MPTCKVSGCTMPTRQWGQLCNAHRCRQRRHGEANQPSIRKDELRSYVRIIRDHIQRNATSPVWGHLEKVWRALVDDAAEQLRHQRANPRPTIRHHRQALEQLERLKGAVRPREAIEVILAMYLLAEFYPHRLRSDRAFKFQLVRRVRGLTDLNAGTWYDHRRGRVRRVYRDLPPRATVVLADWLIELFGGIALYVARHENARIAQKAAAKRELAAALASHDKRTNEE